MLAGVALAAPPAQSTAPVIAGTPEPDQVLTLTPGTWTDITPPATVTDQWESCSGGTCNAVGTASQFQETCSGGTCSVVGTPSPYQVAPADLGHTIEVVESATDATTTASVPGLSSNVLGPVTGNTAVPAVTGIAQEGQVLTLTKGKWAGSPAPNVADQWDSCSAGSCRPVGVLNSTTYIPGPTDVGRTIQVAETATYAGSPAPVQTVTSAPVGPVAPLTVPAAATVPTISGTPQQGQTLTLTQGVWANSPASITDQWEQCSPLGGGCTTIPGQTGPTYTLGPGEVDHTIAVVETASNDGGAGLSASSPGTAVVTATSSTSVVAFSTNSPTADQTVTLVATITSSSGNASPHGSLTFFNGSSAISGCAGKQVNGGQTVTVICPASFAAGTAQISASYVPDQSSLVVGSSSAPTTVTVGKDGTSISLAVTNPVAQGGHATYAATLVLPGSNSGPTEPTGSIEFIDGGQPISTCLSQPLSNLTATCTVSYAARGPHDISAVYGGDANFTAATSSTSAVQVVGSSNPTAVLGLVGSTLQWTFFYHPTYTTVLMLKAFAIGKGTTMVVTCHGKGCPYKTMHRKGPVRHVLSLVPRSHRPHLRAGARITVRLTHRHWVGKYYSFTVRKRRAPLIKVSCLAPGKSTPGVGC
ncbi:MAG TPA: Ig-like domain repeat protein [Solirubrobacteraceae bacterium]